MNLTAKAFLLLMTMLLLFSCGKNDIIIPEKEEEVKPFVLQPFDGVLAAVLPEGECFSFIYPITFTMPDGSSLTLNGDDDSELKDWYEENLNASQRPRLNYPVDLNYESELYTVANDDELARFKDACKELWEFKEDCFSFIYPISFRVTTTETITLIDENDTSLKDWYEANPQAENRAFLVFPVEVEFKDELITLQNDEELARLKNACEKWEAEGQEQICFNFVFPLSISIDGQTLTAESTEELREAVKEWFEANPDSSSKPEFVYPIEIIYEDGLIKELMSLEDLKEAKRDC